MYKINFTFYEDLFMQSTREIVKITIDREAGNQDVYPIIYHFKATTHYSNGETNLQTIAYAEITAFMQNKHHLIDEKSKMIVEEVINDRRDYHSRQHAANLRLNFSAHTRADAKQLPDMSFRKKL